MGILNALGVDNGFTDWWSGNRNTIAQFGAGLASGRNPGQGVALGLQQAQQGRVADDAYATSQKEKAEREKQLNYTIEAMRAAGREDLIKMAQAGYMKEAFNALMKPAKTPIEINGQLVDPDTFEVLGDFRDPEDVAGSGQTEYGLNPIWGQFPDGSYGYGVQGKDGSFKKVDTGDLKPFDPRTLNTERGIGSTVGKGLGARELAAPAMEVNLQRLDTQTDNVIDTIDKATGQAGWWETGLPGAAMGGIPGTGAYDLRKTVTTIKANLGFAELQAMRDASPTGGALGQVAIQELEALQSTLANLDPNQSEAQMKENLALVKQLLERQKMYRRMAAEAKYGVGGEEPAAAPGSDIDSILGGYGL